MARELEERALLASDRPRGAGVALDRLVGPFRRGAPRSRSRRPGFYTDTTVCIGCKACEVACKQWNQLPADGFDWTGNSYDNTGELSATSWRHVKFIEQFPTGADARSRWCCRCRDRPSPIRGVADDERRVQALRHGPVPAGLPDRRHHLQRVRRTSTSSRTSATAAATASPPARSASSPAATSTATRTNARSATTGRRTGWCRRARRRARRRRSSSARSTSCASAPASASRSCTRRGRRRRYLYGDAPRRDLLRAELVLPAGRSPLGLRAAGEAVQPVAAHAGRLRPRGRGRAGAIAVSCSRRCSSVGTEMHTNCQAPPATPTGR